MKILIIIPYFYPALYYGGPVRVTYELARRLVKRGHEVTVYTTDVFDNRRRYHKSTEDIEGVRVCYLRNVSNSLACRYHVFLPVGFYSLLKDTCREYDLVHIHEYYTLLAVAAARLARKHDIPFLLSAHGSLPVTPERGNLGRKILFNKIFGDMTFKGISRVIALNGKEREQSLEFGIEDKKIEIIPNGIDVTEFKDLPDGAEFRKRYAIEQNEKIILFVGRIHEIKGLDMLLNVFKEISGRIKEARLVLVGPDDGYLGILQKNVSGLGLTSKVIFTGLLTGREKLSAYAAADVFVLPSRSEGFPVTALEACASGLPVIVTDRCNFPEVQGHGAGFEVSCDESSLYKTIVKLLDDPAMREQMGKKGKDMVFNKYDWNNIVLRLEEVYRDVSKTS